MLYRVIAEQQSKRELTHLVCLLAVEKYKKVESVNKQNDYETASKKWTDKKKTDLPFVFCLNSKCLNSKFKNQVQEPSKEFLGNKSNVNQKKISRKRFHLYDCRSLSIVLQPSPFFPNLYLIFQFIIIKNGTNKKLVQKLVKRWTYWWSF